MRSLYVHIPFCRGACDYCDFLSFPLENENLLDRFLKALCREMALYGGETFETLYLGGGTPTVLHAGQIDLLDRSLHSFYNLEGLGEYTLEANPETLDAERAHAWLQVGVNRVSLGVQSFDERVLAAHCRNARADDVYRACQLLRQGGLTNLSLDLMLGLQRCQAVPDEQAAAEVFKGDLTRAVAVSPEHLSIYMLSLREESSSAEKHRVGEHPRFSERRMQELYLYSVRFLAHHGFEQYEISNFARPGFESVHNRHYWRGGEYRGLGPGAVSTLGNRRMKNVVSLQEYLSLTERGERPVGEVEILDPSARDLERIMLALRQRAGISPDELMGRISQSARCGLLSYLSEMRALGFCEITSERLALTPRGQLRSNAIISDIARLMERT